MKKLFLITSLLFCSVSFGQDKDIEFTINCEIVDQIVMDVEDGKPQRYSGIKDSFKIGENFPIEVNFQSVNSEALNYYSLTFYSRRHKLLNKEALRLFDDDVTQSYVSLSIVNSDEDIARSNEITKDLYADFLGQQFFYYKDAKIGSKVIILEEQDISLTRYYKNDWQLNYAYRDIYQSHIILGNCMGVSSEYNEILDVMESFEKQKYK